MATTTLVPPNRDIYFGDKTYWKNHIVDNRFTLIEDGGLISCWIVNDIAWFRVAGGRLTNATNDFVVIMDGLPAAIQAVTKTVIIGQNSDKTLKWIEVSKFGGSTTELDGKLYLRTYNCPVGQSLNFTICYPIRPDYT